MSDIDPLHLLQPAGTRVRDPVSGKSVWLAGMLQKSRLTDDGALAFDVVVTPEHTEADSRSLLEAVVANIRGLGFEGEVTPRMVRRRHGTAREARLPRPAPKVPGMEGPGMAPHGGPIRKKPLPGVKHVIAVASGKGGVGKSTVATNLAVGLRQAGYAVGLMDADIYGPSLPTMMNVSSRPVVNAEKKVIPALAYGVRCISIGLVVDPDEAMIWRGPMVMGVVRQFLQDTAWGELDVLVVDMPPGTGDAQLTLIQAVDLAGAVIVTTPQQVALADAIRGIRMFRKLEVPLLGLVQNMAYYELPDGSRDHIFGEDGGVRTAAEHDTEVLADIPLRSSIRKGGDAGLPAVLGDDASAEAFRALARRVAVKLGLDPR